MGGLHFSLTVMAVDPPAHFVKLVRTAEEGGFEEMWVADSSLHARYVYAYLTLVATHTSRMRLGPNCTHPYTRHPAINLNALCTLDEISGGRAIMNIGAGDRPVAEVGYAPAKLAVLREAVVIMRRLLQEQAVTQEGPTFRLRNATLHYRYRAELPIYITASGPKTLEVAGEIADGVIFAPGVYPPCIRFALDHLRAGRARVGRGLDGYPTQLNVFGSLREDEAAARAESRVMAAWFPQTAPHYAELAGVGPELIERVRAAYAGGHFHEAREAAVLFPDELMDRFVVAGGVRRWRDAIGQIAACGVREINIFPIGEDRLGTARALARDVLPHFRS